MLRFYESKVAAVLSDLESEGIIHELDTNYEDMAGMVRERIGNFNEWKVQQRRFKGIGNAVKGLEIELMGALSEDAEHVEGAFRLRSDPVEAARHIRTHFGDAASYNQYRAIRACLAKSGPNHTEQVRSTLMEHFSSEEDMQTIESQLFHLDNWEPLD